MRSLYVVIWRKLTFVRIQKVDAIETEIGRRSNCKIILPDVNVSKSHATIFNDESGFWIRDHSSIGSTTRLDGRNAINREQIQEGSIATVPPFYLAFYFIAPADEESFAAATEIVRLPRLEEEEEDFIEAFLIGMTAGRAWGKIASSTQLHRLKKFASSQHFETIMKGPDEDWIEPVQRLAFEIQGQEPSLAVSHQFWMDAYYGLEACGEYDDAKRHLSFKPGFAHGFVKGALGKSKNTETCQFTDG